VKPWELAEPGSDLARPGPAWAERAFIAASAEAQADKYKAKPGTLQTAAERGHTGKL